MNISQRLDKIEQAPEPTGPSAATNSSSGQPKIRRSWRTPDNSRNNDAGKSVRHARTCTQDERNERSLRSEQSPPA